jgi:hypothetical protein
MNRSPQNDDPGFGDRLSRFDGPQARCARTKPRDDDVAHSDRCLCIGERLSIVVPYGRGLAQSSWRGEPNECSADARTGFLHHGNPQEAYDNALSQVKNETIKPYLCLKLSARPSHDCSISYALPFLF